MAKICEKCKKSVYPLEELKCLDKIWHKTCFRCTECNMLLNMKNYKGYDKMPYCVAHYPKTKATSVAMTPEISRIANNTKLQSQVHYHEEFEKKIKGSKIEVSDDPVTARVMKVNAMISQTNYKTPRPTPPLTKPRVVERLKGAVGGERPSPVSARSIANSVVYSSDGGKAEGGVSQASRKVGSIADYDPVNNQYGSITPSYDLVKKKVGQDDVRRVEEENEERGEGRREELNDGVFGGEGMNEGLVEEVKVAVEREMNGQKSEVNGGVRAKEQEEEKLEMIRREKEEEEKVRKQEEERERLRKEIEEKKRLRKEIEEKERLLREQEERLREQAEKLRRKEEAIKQMEEERREKEEEEERREKEEEEERREKEEEEEKKQLKKKEEEEKREELKKKEEEEKREELKKKEEEEKQRKELELEDENLKKQQEEEEMKRKEEMKKQKDDDYKREEQQFNKHDQQLNLTTTTLAPAIKPDLLNNNHHDNTPQPQQQQQQHHNETNKQEQDHEQENEQESENTKQQQQQNLEGDDDEIITTPLPGVWQALYDFTAQDDDEVSFEEFDVITQVEKIDDGWYLGTVMRTNERGMLPSNYIERKE